MTSPLISLASHPEAQMSCSSLGRSLVYLARRRPIKTSAQDCEIRGGEYVACDRSDSATALKIWLRQAKEGDKVAQRMWEKSMRQAWGSAWLCHRR